MGATIAFAINAIVFYMSINYKNVISKTV